MLLSLSWFRARAFALAPLSSQPRSSSTSSSTTDRPKNFQEYAVKQQKLTDKQRAPLGSESFSSLRNNPMVVFRDFTPFFDQLNLMEPNDSSSTALLRGRRWGKTTLGSAWLAYLRQEAHLFKGTAVEGRMRKEPLIGVHLDISECSSPAQIVDELAAQIKRGMTIANLQGSWESRLPSLGELGKLSATDLEGEASRLLRSLDEASLSSKLKFALFIDEYDTLNIRALQKANEATDAEAKRQHFEAYVQANDFLTNLFTKLKIRASTGTIPFQFTTGSSRLPLKGFWSGANAITDLSFDPGMASVLGYTWEQIEQYFATQLSWLEDLHGMTRAQLRVEMEEWYDRHRWSPKSNEHVFNPCSVHEFMRTGEFGAYWSTTGSNTRVLDSKLLVKDLVRSLTSADKNGPRTTINWEILQDPRLPKGAGESLDVATQKALLVGAGMLAIHPDYQTVPGQAPENIELTIPNKDARRALEKVVGYALKVPSSFNGAVENHLQNNDIVGLFKLMNDVGGFKDTATSMKEPTAHLKEPVVSSAFAALFLAHKPTNVEYRTECTCNAEEGGDNKPGRKSSCDHVIHVPDQKVTHLIEFKMQKSSNDLEAAFKQCYGYRSLVKEGYTGLFTVVIFGDSRDDPTRIAAIETRTEEQLAN